MEQKTNEYRKMVADAFVQCLQEKGLEWKRGWDGGSQCPINAATGKSYKGLNRFWLGIKAELRQLDDPRWATFKQIQDKGWKLQKGAKGEKVEYWSPYDTKQKKLLDWATYEKMLQDEALRGQVKIISKYYYVFNAKEIEGIELLPERPERKILTDAIIEKISGNMGVEILNDGGSMAFYRPSEDKIHLPEKSAFYNDYEYNATALHELSHATGAESRLNRSLGHSFGTGQYAYEELVAEISACFMGEHLSIELSPQHMDNHKAYVQSWIRDISEKPSVLMQAIRDAENSANYLEYQAELISEKDYQKTLSGAREVELEDMAQKPVKDKSTVANLGLKYLTAQKSVKDRSSVVNLLLEKQKLASASPVAPAHEERSRKAEAIIK